MTDTRPRIDFYVLSSSDPGSRLRFACRLTEKVFLLRQAIHNHAADAAQARELDALMWTFRDRSFVPHELYDASADNAAPVTIGHEPDSDPRGDVLINLADNIPAFFDRFERVAEIIDASDASRQAGRERYAFYRDNGYEPDTHRIDRS